VLFQREGGDAVRDGNERNDDHRCVQMGRAARDMVFVSSPFSAGIPVDSGAVPARHTMPETLPENNGD
jgi:hypothetical protein